MKSLAIKHDMPEMATASSGSKEYFPSITLTDKQIPELADMSIGDECTICVKVKLTGMNADNKSTRFNLDCVSAEYDDDPKDNSDDTASE